MLQGEDDDSPSVVVYVLEDAYQTFHRAAVGPGWYCDKLWFIFVFNSHIVLRSLSEEGQVQEVVFFRVANYVLPKKIKSEAFNLVQRTAVYRWSI